MSPPELALGYSIKGGQNPAEAEDIQEPHSLVVSYESLFGVLERVSLRVFRWYETSSGIKVGVMLWPLLATRPCQ